MPIASERRWHRCDTRTPMTAPLCAITGTGGYVGGHLAAFMIAAGWKVRSFTRVPISGDSVAFNLSSETPRSAFVDVDLLIHCAYDFSPRRWKEIQEVNVRGAERLLSSAVAAGVPRVVCLSSISAHAGNPSFYAQAKLQIEQYAACHGAMILRPGLTYGGKNGGMFGRLLTQIQSRSFVPLIGAGNQHQYLLHIDDMAGFIDRYGRLGEPPAQRITLAHPTPWSLKNLYRRLGDALHRRPVFLPLPWRSVWGGLRAAEALGIRLPFSSDSVISFVHQNPAPSFSAAVDAGIACRDFDSWLRNAQWL